MFLLNFIPWYLWNKYKLLTYIEKEIKSISKKWDTICDLFAWSWIVWDYLKSEYKIISNDIEYYSFIINKVVLNFNKNEFNNIHLEQIINETNIKISNTNLNEKLLEVGIHKNKVKKVEENNRYFFYSNFSWIYFSANQCLEIDLFRIYIEENFDWFEKDYLISLWIYWLYSIVNSVWNHFAQPRLIKEKNFKIINNKFNKSFFDVIKRKHSEISLNINEIKIKSENNLSINLDYNDLLNNKFNINTFYIDTPYTIDHYSRFYHMLNTFAKYDYPEVEWIWLYRTDRFQSPFCIKTKAENEFENMIKKIFDLHWANIVLSYSDSYRSLLHKDKILRILNKYYKNVKLQEIDYNYSWLWQSSWNKCKELLFTAKI